MHAADGQMAQHALRLRRGGCESRRIARSNDVGKKNERTEATTFVSIVVSVGTGESEIA